MNKTMLLKSISWIVLSLNLLIPDPLMAMDPNEKPISQSSTSQSSKKRYADTEPTAGEDASLPRGNPLSSEGNPSALKKTKGPDGLSIAISPALQAMNPAPHDNQAIPSDVSRSFTPHSIDPASTVVTMDADTAEVTQQTPVTPLSAATLSVSRDPAPTKLKPFSFSSWAKSPEATSDTNAASSSQLPRPLTTTKPAAPLKDAFYIFNAGQGNAQQATYAEGPGEPFAILYDCGSSAETVNSKILKALSHNKMSQPFLVKKTKESLENLFDEPSSASEDEAEENEKAGEEKKDGEGDSPTLPASRESIESSDNDSFSDDATKETREQSIKMSIKETLRTIKNLFVILSHPDKDHINLLKDSLPSTANVLFILCGNFFVENDKSDLKKDIQDLFSFISERKRNTPLTTYFTFPYFWPSEFRTPYSTFSYADIQNYIDRYSPLEGLPQGIDTHLPKRFQGDFSDFLKMQQTHFQPHTSATPSPFYINFIDDIRLKNIYIWSMNQISDNINNHSPVISFRMPNLEKTFICTGDAGSEVFLKIQKKISKQISTLSSELSSSMDSLSSPASLLLNPIRRIVDAHLHGAQPYIVMLMLPHHGAEKNRSNSMLDLFNPHILGISAGAGSMYRHPSTDLIKLYKKYYKTQDHLKAKVTEFWKVYTTKDAHDYLTFKDEIVDNGTKKEDKKTVIRTRLHNLEKNKLPVLSTGIAGTLHITQDLFHSEFVNHYEYNGGIYAIDFAKAICEHDPTGSKVEKDSLIISEQGEKINISANIKHLQYKGVIFTEAPQKGWFVRKMFISPDKTQLLIPLDIKFKESKNKTMCKFYLGNIIKPEN